MKYTAISLCLLLMACHKEDTETIPLKQLWKSTLHTQDDTGTTIPPYLLENGILFSSDPLDGDYRGYYLLDKHTGQQVWHWKDNLTPIESHTSSDIIGNANGKIVINNRRDRYCIDQFSGKTIWKVKDDWDYGSVILQHNTSIFCGKTLGYPNAHLVRYSFDDHDAHIVWTNPTDSANMREYDNPRAITQVDGDDWILFSDGFVNYDSGKGHPWMTCYNLGADTLVWRRMISDPWFHAGVYSTIVHNNRIYVAESFHVVCLDLFTGEEIWRRTYGNSVHWSGIAIFNENLFAICEDQTFDMISLENGSLLNRENGIGANTSQMKFHKGKIYYVSGADGLLYCYNATTGKLLWTMEGPELKKNRDLSFDSAGIAIDPDTDMLYITDYRHAYGFQILE
ncbi:MAG: PQQ-binding-like beta-propeller repeat protein [Saprospiraceae bacterium]